LDGREILFEGDRLGRWDVGSVLLGVWCETGGKTEPKLGRGYLFGAGQSGGRGRALSIEREVGNDIKTTQEGKRTGKGHNFYSSKGPDRRLC